MPHDSPTHAVANESAAPLAYIPGLDGIRALAVLAVLAYHAGFRVPGGYLGVETFFVLSGFLITLLLRAEHARTGTIRIGVFWARRVRRLLPALLAVLGTTVVLVAIWLPTELATVRADALAALLYVINWKFILAQQAYFDATARPPLLQHLWSLAIEEQFYLVWPVVCAVAFRLRRRAIVVVGITGAALASTLLLSVLATQGGDPSRAYYGTDTRMGGLLWGALLAVVWGTASRRIARPGAIRALDAAGLAALAGVLGMYLWLHAQHPLLYRGGLLLVDALTIVVIAATSHPATQVVPALLGWRPLRWIGERSYGLYLWHWPILLLGAPLVPPGSGWAGTVGLLVVTVLVAALSYRYLEHPIRIHGWGIVWQTCQRAWPPLLRRDRRIAVAAAAVIVLSVVGLARATRVATQSVASAPALVTTGVPTRTVQRTTIAAQTTALPSVVAVGAAPTPADRSIPVRQLPALTTRDLTLAADLQHLLDDVVADGYVPGVVLTVSVPGYAPWVGASGLANRADGSPMESDTVVRLASVSKLFTAVVVLQLVDEGHVALDAPIATYLAERVPNASRITVRDLLQHTSGLYDYLEDRVMLAEMQRDPAYPWSPDELVAYAARFPTEPPGRWDYASTNYVVLGMLVEAVTGQPLADAVHQRIIAPLDLQTTAFLPDDPTPPSLAQGYTQGTNIPQISMAFAYGTANIAATTHDLDRFGRALFGGELLTPATQEAMLQFVDGRGQYGMPALAYGLGVMENRLALTDGVHQPDDDRVLGHIGGYGGFRTALWYAPTSQVTIALSLNQAQADPNQLAAQVLDRVLTSLETP